MMDLRTCMRGCKFTVTEIAATRLECVRSQLSDFPLDPLPEVGDIGAAPDEDDVPVEPPLRLLRALSNHVHDSLRDTRLQPSKNMSRGWKSD